MHPGHPNLKFASCLLPEASDKGEHPDRRICQRRASGFLMCLDEGGDSAGMTSTGRPALPFAFLGECLPVFFRTVSLLALSQVPPGAPFSCLARDLPVSARTFNGQAKCPRAATTWPTIPPGATNAHAMPVCRRSHSRCEDRPYRHPAVRAATALWPAQAIPPKRRKDPGRQPGGRKKREIGTTNLWQHRPIPLAMISRLS